MKKLISFGNWIFHYRNYLFPLFYAALFIPSAPIFNNQNLAVITGLILIVTGISVRLITIGLVYIIRGGVKRKIHAETLVTEGIYKICRNPMYLGNIILIFGFGLFANSLLFLLLFSPLFLLFYAAIISAEEDFLLRKFGQEFIDYKSESSSIIPRLSFLKVAFKGHTFKWRTAIFKEYNSLFMYFSGIALLLLYNKLIVFKIFLITEICLLAIYLLVKYIKYKKLSKTLT